LARLGQSDRVAVRCAGRQAQCLSNLVGEHRLEDFPIAVRNRPLVGASARISRLTPLPLFQVREASRICLCFFHC
jgi:hypothetical protein